MVTVAAYAEQVAAGDNEWWPHAVRHAAGWISSQHPMIDLARQVPLPQLKVQAVALLVYGLARHRGEDPRTVGAGEVLDWVAEHQLPMPPCPTAQPTSQTWRRFSAKERLWRLALDDAAELQQRDLGELLRAAGHQVPAPGHRSLKRYSTDPVIATWLALVDTTPPDAYTTTMDRFPAPLLSLALSGIGEI